MRSDAFDWDEEKDELVRESLDRGFTRLGTKLGISRTTVQRRAATLGLAAAPWTEEQIQILRDEWAKETVAREIANMVNKTRNAVIGKAHRLKLDARGVRNGTYYGTTPSAEPKAPAEKKARVRKAKPNPNKYLDAVEAQAKKDGGRNAPVFYTPAAPIAPKAPISIRELRKHTCRAIVGKGADQLATYCGADVFPGKSFCPGHCAMYYRTDERRRA